VLLIFQSLYLFALCSGLINFAAVSKTQRYFLELSYNGTAYHGWQIQENALSVQEILNKALSTVFRQTIDTLGCGRTDTGVHAKQLFAHFDVDEMGSLEVGKSERWEIRKSESLKDGKSESLEGGDSRNQESISILNTQYSILDKQLLTSLNALLPYDIAVKRMIKVAPDAHARFDATRRSYEYHVHFSKDPFKHNFSWLLRDKPDIGLMNQAAKMLLEYQDFSCFSKSNTQTATNNCVISQAEWVRAEDGLIFCISADRFLRNMVRAIVGTLIQVGKKEIKPEKIRTIIESKNRCNAGASVPACGLYLTKVIYPYIV
jgi:tRNA pseudouridine38-40 synthase